MPKLSASKKEQNKNFIAEKSLETFKEYGYHGTSMSMISSATGLSKGGLYAYFDSKEDLFIYILDYLLNKKPYFLKPVNQHESAYNQLLNQWKRIIFSWTELDSSSTKLVFEFWMESSRIPNYREKLLANYSTTEKYFIDIIEYGKKNGEFKAEINPAIITQIFWSYIDGQVQFWIARDYQPNRDELELLFNQIKILLKGVCMK
ncbi:TetR/AcrR family transcriptional regulator [Virgibacillus sp. 179-BFC.A HS]|uniref:TetR/AcrR family transcriptional regulator n=1 Tax=Tigheibacillus jepli TaxID=3035914 RepID=A0ABU5CDR8_9BACI|nr:TetR/AcrR family transcriptional regulator [Virgibacillus sp. 179-BFC.A HS]MDY0404454.1 TetR/AcrR family transcriptional regulator [Virgibacillus sp. 179-BFC.A HS]